VSAGQRGARASGQRVGACVRARRQCHTRLESSRRWSRTCVRFGGCPATSPRRQRVDGGRRQAAGACSKGAPRRAPGTRQPRARGPRTLSGERRAAPSVAAASFSPAQAARATPRPLSPPWLMRCALAFVRRAPAMQVCARNRPATYKYAPTNVLICRDESTDATDVTTPACGVLADAWSHVHVIGRRVCLVFSQRRCLVPGRGMRKGVRFSLLKPS